MARWFQSTRPARGATMKPWNSGDFSSVSIHAPRAGRDCATRAMEIDIGVSIHAPRAGRDGAFSTDRTRTPGFNPRAPRGARRKRQALRRAPWGFNPRAPRGARHTVAVNLHFPFSVSIHAPRAGRDNGLYRFSGASNVSIHAPRAGRDRSASCGRVVHPRFQSTRPARGAT